MKIFHLFVIGLFCFSILFAQNKDKKVKDFKIEKRDAVYIIDSVEIDGEASIRFHWLDLKDDEKNKSKVTYFIPRADHLFDIPDNLPAIVQNKTIYLIFTVGKDSIEIPLKNDLDRTKDHCYPFSAYIIGKNEMAEGGSSPVIIIKRR